MIRAPIRRRKHISSGIAKARTRSRTMHQLTVENDALWSILVKLRAHNTSEKPATHAELQEHPGRVLNAHHIKPKGLYGGLRWDLRNGMCLWSWQHVRARGSVHDDGSTFDDWALPYLKQRGDLAYLRKKGRVITKNTRSTAETANATLREVYRLLTGREFVYRAGASRMEVEDD